MQHLCRTTFALVLALSLLEAALGAQEISLESLSDGPLLLCTPLHKPNCEWVHFEGPGDPAVGSVVRLDGRAYILQWIGPGYYLDSGAILEPLGEALPGLTGQRWREVYPDEGAIRTSLSWQDVDRNQALSVSDTLVLEPGQALKIKDVRLRLRVRPAEP
jgi:hypothetical protein